MALKNRLKKGETVMGTLLSLPSPEVAEIYSHLAFDWLFLDLEHGAYGFLEAQRMIQAVGGRCSVLTRVPELSELSIKKALDIGSEGVIIPKVNTVSEVEHAVRYAKYQPIGDRGVGAARAHKYGIAFNEYMDTANEQTLVVIQIEHIDGVNQINEIVQVPGIDVMFIGPYDLSGSMGLVGQVDHPKVLEAIAKVEVAAKAKGLALGFFGMTPKSVKPAIKNGYQLITCGTDSGAIISQAKEDITKLKA